MFSFLSVFSLIESPILDLVALSESFLCCSFLTLKVFLEEAIEGAFLDLDVEETSSDWFSTLTINLVFTIWVAQ